LGTNGGEATYVRAEKIFSPKQNPPGGGGTFGPPGGPPLFNFLYKTAKFSLAQKLIRNFPCTLWGTKKGPPSWAPGTTITKTTKGGRHNYHTRYPWRIHGGGHNWRGPQKTYSGGRALLPSGPRGRLSSGSLRVTNRQTPYTNTNTKPNCELGGEGGLNWDVGRSMGWGGKFYNHTKSGNKKKKGVGTKYWPARGGKDPPFPKHKTRGGGSLLCFSWGWIPQPRGGEGDSETKTTPKIPPRAPQASFCPPPNQKRGGP